MLVKLLPFPKVHEPLTGKVSTDLLHFAFLHPCYVPGTQQMTINLVINKWEQNYVLQGVHGDGSILQMDKLSFKEGMWSLYCHTLRDQGASPSPVNRNWIQAKQEIQARLCWGLCSSRWEQKQASFPCLLAPGGVSEFAPYLGGEDRRMSRGRAKEVA